MLSPIFLISSPILFYPLPQNFPFLTHPSFCAPHWPQWRAVGPRRVSECVRVCISQCVWVCVLVSARARLWTITGKQLPGKSAVIGPYPPPPHSFPYLTPLGVLPIPYSLPPVLNFSILFYNFISIWFTSSNPFCLSFSPSLCIFSVFFNIVSIHDYFYFIIIFLFSLFSISFSLSFSLLSDTPSLPHGTYLYF